MIQPSRRQVCDISHDLGELAKHPGGALIRISGNEHAPVRGRTSERRDQLLTAISVGSVRCRSRLRPRLSMRQGGPHERTHATRVAAEAAPRHFRKASSASSCAALRARRCTSRPDDNGHAYGRGARHPQRVTSSHSPVTGRRRPCRCMYPAPCRGASAWGFPPDRRQRAGLLRHRSRSSNWCRLPPAIRPRP
jgi:hypothetical protein